MFVYDLHSRVFSTKEGVRPEYEGIRELKNSRHLITWIKNKNIPVEMSIFFRWNELELQSWRSRVSVVSRFGICLSVLRLHYDAGLGLWNPRYFISLLKNAWFSPMMFHYLLLWWVTGGTRGMGEIYLLFSHSSLLVLCVLDSRSNFLAYLPSPIREHGGVWAVDPAFMSKLTRPSSLLVYVRILL